MDLPDDIKKAVGELHADDLPRELAFAKAALVGNDPPTVYWLAAIYSRMEGRGA